MPRGLPRRARLAVAAAILVVAGLTVHFAGGVLGGFAADALYAMFVAVLIALALPALRLGVAPAVALVVCTAIEVWQLTPVPSALSRSIPGISLVVGTTFSWMDLVAYTVGAVFAVGIEVWSRR